MEATRLITVAGKPFWFTPAKEADTMSAVAEDGTVLFTAHKAKERRYQKLYICSPLTAPTKPEIRRNMLRAQQYMELMAGHYGCRTVAPHAYLPELLDDHIPAERELALSFGKQLLYLCDALVICGNVISKGMAGEIAFAARLGKPILVSYCWELDVEPGPQTAQEFAAMVLHSGKSLTPEELDEVQEKLWHLGDMDDVRMILDSGVHDGDIVFGPVPERCISDIADRKAVFERQKDYPWPDAVEEALRQWRDSEYARLLDALLEACIQTPGNEGLTREEFENSPLLFRSEKTVKQLAGPQDFEVWQAVVPAAGEEQKKEPEAGERNP